MTTQTGAAEERGAVHGAHISAVLEEIKVEAQELVEHQRRSALGAVRMGVRLVWVREKGTYTADGCDTFEEWVDKHMPFGKTQSSLFQKLAPLPQAYLQRSTLSQCKMELIVAAPAWQWSELCQHGDKANAARLRSAISAGEEHLRVHQNQTAALRHIAAVLQGATPFKVRARKVPLQEAAKELLALLKQVKRAARKLGEAQELHGIPGMTQPFVPGLIKEAAAADGEVQAALQRFRSPDSEAKSAPDKDLGGIKGAVFGGDPAPAQPGAAQAGAAQAGAAQAAAPAPASAAPPASVGASAAAPPPAAEDPPAAADPPLDAAPPAAAEAPEPPAATQSKDEVLWTDIYAALRSVLSEEEQGRFSMALKTLLIDDDAEYLAIARKEIRDLLAVARCAEERGLVPQRTMGVIEGLFLQEPLEQRYSVVFKALVEAELPNWRDYLDMLTFFRIPDAFKAAVAEAAAKYPLYPEMYTMTEEERDADLKRIAADIEQFKQNLLAKRERGHWG